MDRNVPALEVAGEEEAGHYWMRKPSHRVVVALQQDGRWDEDHLEIGSSAAQLEVEAAHCNM